MTIHQEARKLPPPPVTLLRDASLFLDFDGTLVEIAARPDGVAVEQHVRDLLAAVQKRLHGRLAIVSGRAAANLGALLGDSSIIVAGSHGAELCWPDGRIVAPEPQTFDAAARALLQELDAKYPGVLVEYKPLGVALHYRQAPEAEADCHAVAIEIADRTGLLLQSGKMVVELRMACADKGTAVRALMQEAPMREGRPVFIGDDETDEAGFRAAAMLGGAGVLVGEARPTAALYRLAGVDQALSWLENAAREAA